MSSNRLQANIYRIKPLCRQLLSLRLHEKPLVVNLSMTSDFSAAELPQFSIWNLSFSPLLSSSFFLFTKIKNTSQPKFGGRNFDYDLTFQINIPFAEILYRSFKTALPKFILWNTVSIYINRYILEVARGQISLGNKACQVLLLELCCEHNKTEKSSSKRKLFSKYDN